MQPSCLYNLISVQPHCSTHSSDVVTLSCPPSSPLPLWSQQPFFSSCITLFLESASQGTLPAYWSWRLVTLVWSHTSVRHFLHHHCHHSITPSVFHFRLKTHLFHKSFRPLFFYLSTHRTDSMDSSCFSFFSGMSVLTLALCAELASWLLVSF